MNDINNKANTKNQENITKKSESSTSEDLSKTLLTPDQKIDKLLEGMNNMNNGVNQTMELFKQMMKFLIENSATTNKMMMEQKGMMIEQKDMMKQFMESNTEQAKTINEFITQETNRWKDKDVLTALQKYWSTTKYIEISYLLKKVSISENINEVNEKGKTLLHLAVEDGDQDLIKILLQHPNIDISIEDKYGDTALKIAERYRRNTEIADLIKDYINKK